MNLYVSSAAIRPKRIKGLPRLQSLTDGEWVGCIQRVIAEQSKQAAVNVVGSGLAHDVDGRSAGAAEIGSIITAIYLKLLHCLLAQIQTDAARVVIRFAPIN